MSADLVRVTIDEREVHEPRPAFARPGLELPGRDPFRGSSRHLLLKVDLAGDAVGIALQGERPIPKMWKEDRSHTVVVGEEVALRHAVPGEEDAVPVAELYTAHRSDL